MGSLWGWSVTSLQLCLGAALLEEVREQKKLKTHRVLLADLWLFLAWQSVWLCARSAPRLQMKLTFFFFFIIFIFLGAE